MAEFMLQTFVVPQEPVFNHEELKQEIAETVSQYKTIVYTDDKIKEAKTDLAKLRKLKDAINSERIARQREYEAPFKAFKSKVDEILRVIDEPIAIIDRQVKEYEKEQDRIKKEEVAKIFDNIGFPDWVAFESIWSEVYLKKSMTLSKIKGCFEERKDEIVRNINTLSKLPEYSFEAVEKYKECRSIDEAMAEVTRIRNIAEMKKAQSDQIAGQMEVTDFIPDAKAKEIEFKKNVNAPAPLPDEKKFIVRFETEVTAGQAKDLRMFCDSIGIILKPIKIEKWNTR